MKPGALAFYRIMAYVTAVLLIVLCLAMVLKYLWPAESSIQQFGDTWTTLIGTGHGFLYIVYLFIALIVSVQLRVPMARMLLVLLAGTIPLGAFFAERRVTHWYHQRAEGRPLSEKAAPESRSAES